MTQIIDLIRAHRKLIPVIVGTLLIQYVDQETVDWIVAVLTVILAGGTPNDPGAIRRVYNR